MSRLVVCYVAASQSFKFKCEPSGTAAPSTATLENIEGMNIACNGTMIEIIALKQLVNGAPQAGVTRVDYEINGSGSVLTTTLVVDGSDGTVRC